MNVIKFISQRYLFSKKNISLVSALTLISITGVTIGTALLIVVLSVFNGFFDVIQSLLLSFDPDIRIETSTGESLYMNRDIDSILISHPDVIGVTPFIEGKGMLVFRDDRNEVITVRGIEKESFIRQNELRNSIVNGVFDLSVKDNRPGILLGTSLANRYGIQENDEIAILSASGMRRALTQFSVPRVSRYSVRGNYSMQQILDEDIVYVDLTAAQRLFNIRNQISGYNLKLTNTNKADRVKKHLETELGDGFAISTWYDLQKPLYDVMYLEKWGSYFILMIIVIVAVLNIVGSLTMIVIQKQRDIGILISMGMTPEKIKKIFQSQGLQIGLIGCGIGGGLGLLLSWIQSEYGLLKLSSAFIIDAYPASINPFDVLLVLGVSMLLCVAASWYPAKRAAAVEPADAVRNE
ncbi:MAG: FtsX-like permease family protein [Balneolaceae bacterium]